MFNIVKVPTCISVPPFAGCKAAPAPATRAAPALFEIACAAWSAACADADCKQKTFKSKQTIKCYSYESFSFEIY